MFALIATSQIKRPIEVARTEVFIAPTPFGCCPGACARVLKLVRHSSGAKKPLKRFRRKSRRRPVTRLKPGVNEISAAGRACARFADLMKYGFTAEVISAAR